MADLNPPIELNISGRGLASYMTGIEAVFITFSGIATGHAKKLV